MKSWFSDNWFKFVSALFLFVAIGNHPYGYYQVTHWIVAASAGYAAYQYLFAERTRLFWAFVVVTICFNPIVPFYFDKSTWRFLDLVVAILFVVSMFFPVKRGVRVPENKNFEETIRIRKTAPIEEMDDETLANSACTMPMYYEIKRSELKQFLKENPELIAWNRDIDLASYL